ncbi:MAG TPA: SMC family ATPase [Thermomicrobiaceae bacterium]|nr:SMC family ATPase [Thermomicrobiaceae bacterium]
MIPTYLAVRNFMSYRDPVEIDFRGIHVACLSGDNGAGKSALLDCITWALWGKARVNSDRELLSLGTTEMEVLYSFLLDGQEVRVTRKRGKGGEGPLSLELELRDGERWRTHTGPSVRETQQTINGLLRMDYDTFINSAFILQGRADEFTTKTPSARKQVLGEILNLADYDRYEERARQELRDRERRLREIDEDLAELDRRLANLPELRFDVEELGREVVFLGLEADGARVRLSEAQARVQALEFIALRRDAAHRQVVAFREELAENCRLRDTLDGEIARHREVLVRRDEIERRYAELVSLRERQHELSLLLAERQILIEERAGHEQRVQEAVHRLESEIHSVGAQIGERELVLNERAAVEAQQAELLAELATLAGVDEDIRAFHEEQAAREQRRGGLEAENQRLKTDMDEIKARLDQVAAADALCPVCRRELHVDERARLQREYRAEGTALGDRFRANRAAVKELDLRTAEARTRLDELQRRRTRSEALQKRAAALAERLARVGQAGQEIVALRAHHQALTGLLDGGKPGAEHRAELARIDAALAVLRYDRDEHRRVDARARELQPAEKEQQDALIAGTAVERDEARRVALTLEAEKLERQLAEAEAEEVDLAAQLGQLEALLSKRDELQVLVDTAERRRGEAQERLGAAQQRLDDCLRLQDDRDDLAALRLQVADDKMVFEELALAFGKRGIQAMIIENVIPELQDEANAILDKMPGNTMRVEFRTQRQARSTDSTIETLDIVISDEAGRRPYELYSGGEAFRANFAIRVALSTLLARRAGTRLQTLVIDEGFGTQDTRGRDGIVEAIRAIEPDFETILIITHIPELKELFPTRIEVTKTTTGSQVQVI